MTKKTTYPQAKVWITPMMMVTLLTACGGDPAESEKNLAQEKQGYTSCGGVECKPGQYCSDERFMECSSGCLSSDNCAGDQSCSKDAGKNEGRCVDTQVKPPPTTDQLQRCLDSCQVMVQCGLMSIQDSVECNGMCHALSEAQQKSLADCVEPWDCAGGIPGCLVASGVECGGSYTCPGGQSCVGNKCH